MTAVAIDKTVSEDTRFLLSVIAAVALHLAIALMLIYGMSHKPQAVVPQLAIKGVMVDHSAERKRRERAEAEQRAREQEEANRQAEEKRRADDEANKREAELQEQKKKQEAEQAETLKREKVAEQKRQKEAEQKRKSEDAKKQAAAAAKKREAEIKAKQTEKLQAERDAREQAQRESELKRQLAEEEGVMQAQNSGLLSQYVALIEQRVVRNWNRPASAKPGIQCEVKVTQAPGGTVLSVSIDKCNGDQAVRQSIEAAVHKSSPLPPPPDARLFQRVLVLIFRPAD